MSGMDFMRCRLIGLGLGLGLGFVVLGSFACTAQPESDDTTGLVSTTGSMTTDVTATTIPLPGDSTTSGITGDDTTGSTGEPTSDGSDSGGSGGSGGSGTSSGSATDPSSSGDTAGTVYDVEWCRLQHPPSVTVAVDEPFTVYVRLYVPGLTDQSTGNDPAPELVVEMGYGLDGSDPSTGMGAPWSYIPAMPNVGWDDVVEPNNDEYQADLIIDAAGIYDYAARISGNGGMDWVYCDLDDLLTGGYTPDQAGHAQVDP